VSFLVPGTFASALLARGRNAAPLTGSAGHRQFSIMRTRPC